MSLISLLVLHYMHSKYIKIVSIEMNIISQRNMKKVILILYMHATFDSLPKFYSIYSFPEISHFSLYHIIWYIFLSKENDMSFSFMFVICLMCLFFSLISLNCSLKWKLIYFLYVFSFIVFSNIKSKILRESYFLKETSKRSVSLWLWYTIGRKF